MVVLSEPIMSTNKQPESTTAPSLRQSSEDVTSATREAPTNTHRRTVGERVADIRDKVSTRHGWVGDYDYAWLCTPVLPFMSSSNRRRRNRQPPFYAVDQELPLLLAITTGLQHALAMLAGVAFSLNLKPLLTSPRSYYSSHHLCCNP